MTREEHEIRNQDLRRRFQAGESADALCKETGLGAARMYQILKPQRSQPAPLVIQEMAPVTMRVVQEAPPSVELSQVPLELLLKELQARLGGVEVVLR